MDHRADQQDLSVIKISDLLTRGILLPYRALHRMRGVSCGG
jgi:hypothetical protein